MAGAFVKHNPYSREIFVRKICLARKLKMLTQQSTLRPASVISALSSDEVQEVPAVTASNALALVSAHQF